MAYHETFWATGAEVAAAMLVATAVALAQSIDATVQRVRERRRETGPVGCTRPEQRHLSLARSYLYGITSLIFTMAALLLSMASLLAQHDLVPAWAGASALLIGVALIFVQVFVSASVKLAQASTGERRS